MNKEYLGILVDNLVFHGIPNGRTGYEKIDLYEEAAKKHGFTLCFFRLKDIEPGKHEITAYVKGSNNKYKKVLVPTPKVIHNRGLHFSKEAKIAVDTLLEDGKILYNPWNRFKKLEIHGLLSNNQELHPHLPETHWAEEETILKMLNKYGKIILKPNGGSLGQGLMKIESNKAENILTLYLQKERAWKSISFAHEIPEILKKRLKRSIYIAQEFIPLARYKGSVYDVRVYCQKNGKGEWQITGAGGKVAQGDVFITNLAKGGKNFRLDELLDPSFDREKLLKDIEDFSILAAKELEKEYPRLADLGFDIGITTDGFPMFIECNGRGLRMTLRNINMHDKWKAAFANPVDYGKYLLETEG
ncbi:glutathione synthase/RimK-type ligase-like ATP-grasp enzyme [Desulfitispora alkaliphila]|uniref:YheC/YheD family endospore coat-associated protein n=1 Tax=Desulfitispora alkaliphila TaxID=622674 RepID=UPI003D2170D7